MIFEFNKTFYVIKCTYIKYLWYIYCIDYVCFKLFIVRYIFFVLFFACIPNFILANVIEIGTWIHPSAEHPIRKDQYILVDFWATWCGPCIKAMDHLSELSKTTEDKVVYISISNENAEIVKQFFSKREAKTIIATDYEGRTFKRFNVTSIPYSVLIAPDGSVAWQGMPSNMNFDLIAKLINSKRKPSIAVNKKIVTHKEVLLPKEKDKSLTLSLANMSSKLQKSEHELSHSFVNNCRESQIVGSFKDIASSILQVPAENVILKDEYNNYAYFSLDTCLDHSNKFTALQLFVSSLNLKYTEQTAEKDIFELKLLDSTMLWSAQIYEWNEDQSASFISGEGYLQADNFQIHNLVIQLSNLLEKEIVYKGSYNLPHDWNLSFDTIENLIHQLKDEYGIEMVAKKMPSTSYVITPVEK